MMLSNITVPLLGLVDTAIIGHLSAAYYLGGVALGSTLFTLIVWLLGFLRMATTGLTAQAFGAGNAHNQKALLYQGLLLAVLLGSSLVLLHQPLLELVLSLSAASSEVLHYCREYFSVRILSLPLTLANLVMLGWLLGRQSPRAAMWQLILANLVNIALDVLFVLGLGMGVKGAALASVLADVAAFAVAAVFVRRALSHMKAAPIQLTGLFQGLGRLLRLNRDIFIRSLCLQLTFAFMNFKGAGIGDTTVAANAVLLNFLLLVSYALDGIAYYGEAETGAAIGRRDGSALLGAVTLALGWSAMFALLFSAAFALGGDMLIQLMTDISAVQEAALTCLPWLVLMPILAFGSYLFDGVYIGATQGKVMRNSMLLATFGVFLPVWFLSQQQGNHALWLAMSAFMAARSLSLGWHFYRFHGRFIEQQTP
ncbi:MATE family efflux transporter [Shewanella sp. JM162201]|uniref:MATE family efflux transporter n=1 Tax=Shewanella jiangmenensis TaxID=2837387 RepID=A0ABS5V406_9GAMM|nr:MATE family efflux transporter [Shewanella jiangmenensis]MBT1445184.1 MATE family efflux transporter [Shewanella jiangmenensis]